MDRGSKPCRTLESTTWGYFEDSGRAVSAEQIPPSYRNMAQLGFRHHDDLHYFGHFILFIKEHKILFCISKWGNFYGSAFLMVQRKIRCFYGWFLSVRKWWISSPQYEDLGSWKSLRLAQTDNNFGAILAERRKARSSSASPKPPPLTLLFFSLWFPIL